MIKFVSRLISVATISGIAAWSVPSFADVITDDPLHTFCYGNSTCADNNTVTPTASTSPQFGFSISPGPNTGTFFVDILVPTNEVATPGSTSFGITGTQGGAADNAALSATASFVGGGAWTSGDLTSFLKLSMASGSPPNPISAWLPSTQTFDAGATGYYVFQADLGTNELQANNDELSGPELNLDEVLPEGTLIVGFLETSKGYISTAQSGALLVDSPAPVPEPSTLAILAVALLSLAAAYRRKRR